MVNPSNLGDGRRPAANSVNRRALVVVTALFFMWGFVTVLNDILIPHLKAIFDLNYAEVMLIQFSFFSAYFVFSMPSGKLVDWVGYKGTMIAGLCTMGAGALLFIAAASAASFPLFLAALVIVAAGMTAMQVSANPYVAVLGPPETASSRLNLAQAFNSLGTTIAPFFGSLVILSGAPRALEQVRALTGPELQQYRLQEAATVKMPYLGIGLILIALAISMAALHLPELTALSGHDTVANARQSIWKHKHLLLAAIGIFVYVGAEVSIGSFLVNYLSQPEIGGLTEKLAARYVSVYWGGAMVGRFVGSALLQKLRTKTVLAWAAVMACALVLTSMASFGHVAMWSIIAVGLFNSVMFPSIFTLGIEGLGALTSKGSGVLIAAIVGGAIIPEVQGLLADRIGIHHAFLLPSICYVYIAWFAMATVRTPAATSEEPVPVEPV